MRSPWEEEEEEENWKLWLLGNGNYPIHRLRTRSRHVPRMTDRGKRGRCESRRTPTRSWLKSLSSSSSSPLPIVRETYACNVRIPFVIIRDTIIQESRIGTIRSTTTLETSQALLGNERKIDESLSARPALANFVFTESWIPSYDRILQLLPST